MQDPEEDFRGEPEEPEVIFEKTENTTACEY